MMQLHCRAALLPAAPAAAFGRRPGAAALPPRSRVCQGHEEAGSTPGFTRRGGLRPLRAFEEELAELQKLEDTPGVATLLERDAKSKDVDPDQLLAAFSDEQLPSSSGKGSGSGGKKQGGAGGAPAAAAAAAAAQQQEAPAAATQEERGPAGKRAEKLKGEASAPTRAREAIDRGLQEYAAGRHQAALDLFQLSLELPGSGFMRLAGSPKEYSCASEGEENAALYNMACCWAALGQKQSALTVLEALLENNFEDLQAIRTDPDLASVRGADLDKLLSKYDGLVAKLFGKKKEAPSSNKPWIQW